MLAVAAAGEADISLARFSRAIDHAAEHRERHWCLDVAQAAFQRLYRADHVKALPRTAGAGNHPHAAGSEAERFQYFETDAHFLFRLCRERDADGIANPRPKHVADADARFDRAADQAARLGNSQMQRAIHRIGQLHIGGDGKEHVRGFNRHLVFVKIVILQ